MYKFFVEESQIINNEIDITGEDINHIKNVLKKSIGDEILICNKSNGENFICSIEKVSKEKVVCEIIEKENTNTESNIRIDIFQGLPKADKMELIIQKGTELRS